jgi:hypothetical protein
LIRRSIPACAGMATWSAATNLPGSAPAQLRLSLTTRSIFFSEKRHFLAKRREMFYVGSHE